MKNIHRLSFLVLIAGLFFLASCTQEVEDQPGDAIVESYQALNGQKASNGKMYIDVNLPEDHVFQSVENDDILTLLESGTGVIYFGFPECPWCRAALRVMDEAAKAVNLETIYYVNVYDERDVKELDENGKVVVTEEGTQFYADILAALGDAAPEYEGLNDPSIRRIYTPFVIVLVDGEVVASHLGTIESQADPFVPMTQDQYNELSEIYKAMFSEIPGCGEGKNIC